MPRYEHTICWDCAKACAGCPWSRVDPKPVEGWVATPTKVKLRSITNKYGDGYDKSYIVHSCPLFERDAVEHGMRWSDKENTINRRNYAKKK